VWSAKDVEFVRKLPQLEWNSRFLQICSPNATSFLGREQTDLPVPVCLFSHHASNRCTQPWWQQPPTNYAALPCSLPGAHPCCHSGHLHSPSPVSGCGDTTGYAVVTLDIEKIKKNKKLRMQ